MFLLLDCPDGFYGHNCSLRCPDNCMFCQKQTGLCEECYPGFFGHQVKNKHPKHVMKGEKN